MTPKTETDLAEMIMAADAPLRVQGGGTRPIGHARAGDTISTAALTGIELYEPGALTIVAKAGTPLEDIDAALAAEGQRLAFEPMDHRALLGTTGTPTVGGMVATNASGPRRIQVGACRDSLLGVKFVDGRGQHISNGGRVMKNVTGYDLVKLMAGSYGTLGVLTEVALKVLPRTETESTLILHGADTSNAVAAMSAALGSPYEVTGAAHIPLTADDQADTLLRIEGSQASVAYRLGELKSILAQFGDLNDVHGEPSRQAWQRIRDVDLLADATGDVWRVSIKPTDAPDIVAKLGEDAQLQLDWGGGLIWACVPSGTDLRAHLGAFQGHATLIRASADSQQPLPTFHPQPAPLMQLEHGLRARFDPRGILNAGMMGHAA
ncbi:MAG: FAD-binding protein [Roseovarius sp.]